MLLVIIHIIHMHLADNGTSHHDVQSHGTNQQSKNPL
jgi:hypothetical protein